MLLRPSLDSYDRCDSGPIGENNYTAETILGHIGQLAGRFRGEIDAVYALQAGLVLIKYTLGTHAR